MNLDTIRIGDVEMSRLVVGANPFCGFSHQSPERDEEMRAYHTDENVIHALRRAEAAGITTHLARLDEHVVGYYTKYRDAGGTMNWIVP